MAGRDHEHAAGKAEAGDLMSREETVKWLAIVAAWAENELIELKDCTRIAATCNSALEWMRRDAATKTEENG